MKLREILPPDVEIPAPHADLDVGGVTADSRLVKPGDLFVAIAGGKTDGLRFAALAVAAGAVAVVAGGRSRRKRVSLQGVSPDRVREWMARL